MRSIFWHRDSRDLRPLPLLERRLRLERLFARSDVSCLKLVAAFGQDVDHSMPTTRL
jgi:hypothetical protein